MPESRPEVGSAPEDPGLVPHRQFQIFLHIRGAHGPLEEGVKHPEHPVGPGGVDPAALLLRLPGELAGPFPEDLRIRKRVPAETVCAVHPAGHLSAGEEAGNRRPALRGDPEPAHDVVGGGRHLHRLPPYIHAVGEELLEHHREPGLDPLRREMGHVEVDPAAARPAPFQHLGRYRPGHYVPCRELHPVGIVALHEPFPSHVQEDPPFAPDRLRHQPAAGVVGVDRARRVELDHLHIDQLRPCAVGHGKPVPGPGGGVRGYVVGLRPAPRRKHRRVGREEDGIPVPVESDRARDRTLLARYQVDDRDLLVELRIRRVEAIKEGHHHLVAGPVPGVAGPGEPLPPKRPLRHLPVIRDVEYRPPPDEIREPLRRLPGEEIHERGIVEVCPPLERILAVDAGRVLIPQHGVESAFCHRRTSAFSGDGLGDQDHVAVSRGFDRSPRAGAAASDNQHMRVHYLVYKHLISLCVVYYHKVIAGDT